MTGFQWKVQHLRPKRHECTLDINQMMAVQNKPSSVPPFSQNLHSCHLSTRKEQFWLVDRRVTDVEYRNDYLRQKISEIPSGNTQFRDCNIFRVDGARIFLQGKKLR